MNPSCQHQSRRKAVWGPKRTLLAALVVVMGITPEAYASGAHGRQVKNVGAGAPNSFAKNYKMDDEVTRRSMGPANGLGKTRVIVTLVPGAQLPNEFKKYSKNRQLDLINGQVLELPNGVLKQLASHPSIFRVHYDRPLKKENYRTAITVGATTVRDFLGFTGAGVG